MIENEEAKKLSETLDFIDREISRLTSASGERKEAVRARNRDFMAENPFGSVYGAAVDMIRHNENDLAEAEAMRREAYILDKMRLAPYFGRVDFRYDDDGETERIYVGIKTLTDGKTFFVYGTAGKGQSFAAKVLCVQGQSRGRTKRKPFCR